MNENIFEHLPNALPDEITNILVKSDKVRIERIVSLGQTTPEEVWYDQDENEWVILLQGFAGITFEGSDEILLNPGDYFFIPAHKKHKVTFTSRQRKSVWLAIFF